MYTWLWSHDVNTMRPNLQMQRRAVGCTATRATIITWLFLAENGQEPTAESNSTASPCAVGTASLIHFSSLTVHSHPCSTFSFVTSPFMQLCYELDLGTDPGQIWFCFAGSAVGSLYSCRKIRPGPWASAPTTPAAIKAGTRNWGKLTASSSSSASLCQLRIPMKLQKTRN